MARTKQSSPTEDFVDLVARLPWWVGAGFAVVSYFGLNAFASAPLPVIRASTDMGEIVSGSLWRGLAHAGQYILPFLFILGAAVSALRRHKRRALFNQINARSTIDALEGLTWKEFELLVGEGFRAQGYAVHESGGGGADGGVDLVLSKNGDKLLVQCKQWRAFKVGVSVEAIQNYVGALRSKLRDRLNSAVSLHTAAIYHRDRLVIALDVSEGRLPVSIHDDNRLWQRRQSSNISVPPADWTGRNTDPFSF